MFVLSETDQNVSAAQPALYSIGTGVNFLGVKWPVRDSHSTPSNAEFKDE